MNRKNRLNVDQLEMIVNNMKMAKHDHPKASITFDAESREILITYPLPEDFAALRNPIYTEDL